MCVSGFCVLCLSVWFQIVWVVLTNGVFLQVVCFYKWRAFTNSVDVCLIVLCRYAGSGLPHVGQSGAKTASRCIWKSFKVFSQTCQPREFLNSSVNYPNIIRIFASAFTCLVRYCRTFYWIDHSLVHFLKANSQKAGTRMKSKWMNCFIYNMPDILTIRNSRFPNLHL